MKMFNLSRTHANLIILGIIMTPVFGISEVLALISGALTSQSVALTPVYIKALKDIVFIAIIMIGIAEVSVRRRIFLNSSYAAFIVTVVCSIFLSLYFKNFLTILAGFRWILPVLIIPFIYRSVATNLQNRIAKWMITLFILGLLLQIAQLFLIKGWYGLNSFGLSKRNPGFYLIPSSMACFSALTAYYACFYCTISSLRRSIVFVLVPVSILLTASATGFIALALLWGYLLYCKFKQKLVLAITITVFFIGLLAMMPILTDREDIYVSLLDRSDILSEVVSLKNIFVSPDFGDATNTAMLLRTVMENGEKTSFIVDSTATSLIYNTGMLSFVFFAGFLYYSLRNAANKANISFFLVISPFVVTSILFELFPANLLLMVNIAFFYKQGNYWTSPGFVDNHQGGVRAV